MTLHNLHLIVTNTAVNMNKVVCSKGWTCSAAKMLLMLSKGCSWYQLRAKLVSALQGRLQV